MKVMTEEKMNDPVRTQRHGPVGVIIIDHPPVNAASHTVRRLIADSLRDLAAEPAIAAIVIACAGKTFIAGADVSEFGKPRLSPTLPELCDQIEACAKPVIAALHGTALGGGFEIALACHFRVAIANSEVGLPEVTLGLLPGAGGANRLARLIGPAETLNCLLSGERVAAARAASLGAIDQLGDGEAEALGIAFAQTLLAAPRPWQMTRMRGDRIRDAQNDLDGFDQMVANALRKFAGQDAPAACARSLRRALTLPFDAALAEDRVEFQNLADGVQSKALRYLFSADRRAGKAPPDATPRKISQVAILGAGLMGSGIAMCFASAGLTVRLIDRDEDAARKGVERIEAQYRNAEKRGTLSAEEVTRRLGRITASGDRAAVEGCDLVIEAVFEDMALKQEILADVERRLLPGSLLATNSSALDIDVMASVLARPQDFIGLHFFSPAHVMRLLEIVIGRHSSPDAIASGLALGKTIQKLPVLAGNCDGFIGNRMLARRSAQVEWLLQRGVSPAQIDGALRAFGFPMGPCETNDMSGLDVSYAIRKRRGSHFPIADAIVESGGFGQKTQRGYYLYQAGSRTPLPNPEIDKLSARIASTLGITRRAITDEEIIERILLALINEGARILEEGIAARASDIDVVWAHGYGFPKWRGGPIYHADQIGLNLIAERSSLLAADGGDELRPARLILELAAAGKNFADWDEARPERQIK